MTKQELVAALLHDPIVIEKVATFTYYRVAPHATPNTAENCMLIGLVPIAGALLPEDFSAVYARAGGKTVKLGREEVAAIVGRLQEVFTQRGVGGERPVVVAKKGTSSRGRAARRTAAMGRQS